MDTNGFMQIWGWGAEPSEMKKLTVIEVADMIRVMYPDMDEKAVQESAKDSRNYIHNA